MRRAKREVATARRYGRPLSLLIADIDFFKKVNDTYGHGVGDVAIRMVADICAQTLRESDLVARIGGEEFVILMPETTGESACSTAERLRKAIAAIEISADERSFSITVSLGVTEWSPEDENVEATLARADGALYEGKQGGRNRVVMHMPQVIHTTGHQDASTPGDRLPVAASTIRH